jgi:hypothetical protein
MAGVISLAVAGLILLIGTGWDARQTYYGVLRHGPQRERNSLTRWFMAKLGVRTGVLVKTIGFDLVLLGGGGVGILAFEWMLWPAVVFLWVFTGLRQWQAGQSWTY